MYPLDRFSVNRIKRSSQRLDKASQALESTFKLLDIELAFNRHSTGHVIGGASAIQQIQDEQSLLRTIAGNTAAPPPIESTRIARVLLLVCKLQAP